MQYESGNRTLAIETDTALASLYRKQHEAGFDRAQAIQSLRFYTDGKYSGFRPEDRIAELNIEINALTAKIEAIVAEMRPLEAIFNKHRWTRAFLVVSSGHGHVHSSMNCTTCYPTTVFNWLPGYSGEKEAIIVEHAGERACTVCFPSAPVGVKGTRIYSDDELAAQKRAEEKAAIKIARDAKKAASAPNADGSPLTIVETTQGYDGKVHSYNRVLNTEITAQTEYVRMASALAWRAEQTNPRFAIEVEAIRVAMLAIETALAGKHGTTIEAERARLTKKVADKAKKDGR